MENLQSIIEVLPLQSSGPDFLSPPADGWKSQDSGCLDLPHMLRSGQRAAGRRKQRALMRHIRVSPRGSSNCFFMIVSEQLGFPRHERAAWAITEDLRGRVIRGRAECDGDPGQTDHEWTITGRGAHRHKPGADTVSSLRSSNWPSPSPNEAVLSFSVCSY